jgi:hypothetical protein
MTVYHAALAYLHGQWATKMIENYVRVLFGNEGRKLGGHCDRWIL